MSNADDVPSQADADQVAEIISDLQHNSVHLNAHEVGALPCLCKRCFDSDCRTATAQGMDFVLDVASSAGRLLLYWLPTTLVDDRENVRKQVASRMPAKAKKS